MKSIFTILSLAALICTSSCGKLFEKDHCKWDKHDKHCEDKDKNHDDYLFCGKDKDWEMSCVDCVERNFEDFDQMQNENVETYILAPLGIDEECGCYVFGKVKYVVDGKTAAIVDYGDGSCDFTGTKYLCPNGNCGGKEASCCTFSMNCTAKEE